ncbi:MAG: hypothetical protein CM1200mP13_14970 [Candidatus Pelagibacterales bacterium]|nr:MAG: hypothetical protein CM1200mP13_14970 [Pelagibacterales bacterium]
MGNKCGAHTVPYIKNKNLSPILLMRQPHPRLVKSSFIIAQKRGLNPEEAVGLKLTVFEGSLQQFHGIAVEAKNL